MCSGVRRGAAAVGGWGGEAAATAAAAATATTTAATVAATHPSDSNGLSLSGASGRPRVGRCDARCETRDAARRSRTRRSAASRAASVAASASSSSSSACKTAVRIDTQRAEWASGRQKGREDDGGGAEQRAEWRRLLIWGWRSIIRRPNAMPTCSRGSMPSKSNVIWSYHPPERGPAPHTRHGHSPERPGWGRLGTEGVTDTPHASRNALQTAQNWRDRREWSAEARILRGIAGGLTLPTRPARGASSPHLGSRHSAKQTPLRQRS